MSSMLRNILKRHLTTSLARSASTTPSASQPQAHHKSEPDNVDPDRPMFDMPNPFTREQQKCILCRHGIEANYKNVKLISQFQSPYTGRVYGRHITGLCKAQQTRVEREISKAQQAGLMGTYNKDPSFLKDPLLFDPERPIRPHRF